MQGVGFSQFVLKKLREIYKENPVLYKKIHKRIELLLNNPKYPALRNHKLLGKLKNMWSISIERDLRMVYIFTETGTIYFTDIGTPDKVYRK